MSTATTPVPAAPTTTSETATDPAPPKPARGERYPLDSIRALAAISVLLFHAYQNNWVDGQHTWDGLAHSIMVSTDLAVDLFFVISGFLLWIPVSRALLAGRTQRSGRQLVARRAARLLPLYVIVLLVAWAIANPGLPGHWQDLVAHLTMTHVYSDQYIFWTVGPTWTLAIEFHAFVAVGLMLPLISLATPRLATRGRRLAVLAGIPIALGTIGLAYLTWHIAARTPHTEWTVWFGPVAKMHLFALGMGLAVVCAAGVRIGRSSRRALVAIALVTVVVGVLSRDRIDEIDAQWLHVAFGVMCAAVLAAIVLTKDTQPRWLTWGPTVWIGVLSYSIYLVHEPILKWLRSTGALPPMGTTIGIVVTAALTLGLTLVVARIVNASVEKPFMAAYEGFTRAKDRYREIGSEPSPTV